MFMMINMYIVFMILLIFYVNWNVYILFFIILMIIYSSFNLTFFFSNISYMFGVDHISYMLIMLSFFIISLMLLSSNYICSPSFLILNLILSMSLYVIFSILNMFLMYLFFEFSLIPLIILILGWGVQPERLISVLYLFFYTLFASLPLLLIIILFYLNFGCLFFDYHFNYSISFLLHFFMVFAFLVKLPMFMFHYWLPKAHVQAPVSGSMILAGLFLKIGGYGLIRFMFIYEYLFMNYSYIWYSLSMWGSIVVSLICFIQGDIKCLIAYSSVCHMGMCLMGLLTMTYWGLLGSYLMMIGHGLCSSGMFCMANLVYERLLSRSFFINKGMINFMPSLSLIWFILCCFNMSCPPSINFLSELIIMGSMMNYFYWSFIYMIFISFLSACFSIYLFSYCYHGLFHNCYSYSFINVKEYLLLLIHLLPIFLIMLIIDSFFF
uniref:NADH-ubiquinone oxidoreductase chain 4 n=1 Tax=Sahlbergotettix salicicola TaxID=2937677 RepID=A0A9E9FUU8_9HEMI|nr:NADH dehydrogenase subunit 4 [Sahlbergotettix salicicola]WAP91679.1 NADH dehydrogenase subunit 4 [Sahlbergotettix salicicola]